MALLERLDDVSNPIRMEGGSADVDRLIEKMVHQVARHAGSPVVDTAIPRLSLSRVTRPSTGTPTIHKAVVCLILQGAKRVTIGDATLNYDASHYFVASLDVPSTGEILTASEAEPYLGLGLELNRTLLADLIATLPADPWVAAPRSERLSFTTAPVTGDLIEAWARLVALLDRPGDIAALAPVREREILYQLLRGPLSAMLRQMAHEDGRLARIRRALDWIRDHHSEPLGAVRLAEIAGMSIPTFNRHFRAATALSPLQYQKSLRLCSARRFLLSGMSATEAAYAVGYESPSQFSRDYHRAYGLPPSRQAKDALPGSQRWSGVDG